MGIRVKASAIGFYGGQLRYVGDEFTVEKESELGRWMEVLPGPPVELAQPQAEDTDTPKVSRRGRPPKTF